MSLAQTSIDAINLIKSGIHPKQAWIDSMLKNYSHSTSMQKKDCPRNAFLGLCSEGLVKGVKVTSYTNSKKNKDYAVAAVKLLKVKGRGNYTSKTLWLDVLKFVNADTNKQHSGQLDVVLALWDEGLIK
jgi:hypothetical protein